MKAPSYALTPFADGEPLTIIQVAEITNTTRRKAGRDVGSLARRGYLTVKDCAGDEMAGNRYLGTRYAITAAGIDRLRNEGSAAEAQEAEALPGETSVQYAVRTQPTSVWGLAA